jgi:PleD family two-component response regulator
MKIQNLDYLITQQKSDLACYFFQKRSDQALLRAKETGRDKICIWTPEGIVDSTY